MKSQVFVLAVSILVLAGCAKDNTTPDPCTNVTISISGNVMNPSGTAVNGSIIATASGGTGPYTYSLNNGAFQSSGQFVNLTAGSYTLIAKSSNGCSGTKSFTLTSSVPCTGVTITITPTITGTTPCVNASGLIAVSASGGAAPYTYNLNNGTYQSSSTFQGLNNGTYQLGVKDTNASGGVNLSTDCSIVSGKDRIKARAVDGNPSPMPSSGLLPAAERQKITDWINAGGRVID